MDRSDQGRGIPAPPGRPGKNEAPRGRLHLGEFLIQAGVLSRQDLDKALGIQAVRGGRLGTILVGLELCTEDAIRTALREQLRIEVVDLDQIRPDPGLLDLLTPEMINKYRVIPLKRENRKLWIAMVDPYNLVALDDIRFKTGLSQLAVTICTEAAFKRFVGEHLVTGKAFEEVLKGGDFYNRAIKSLQAEDEYQDLLEDHATPLLAHKLKLASAESPIVTLCNYVLLEAIRWQASDIHIEPYETSLRIRLRVDGHLRTILSPPKKLAAAVVARLKVMGEMDITMRRRPQDGHLSVTYEGEIHHFRVSTIPTFYGEKCVLRLLQQNLHLSSLDDLQLPPATLEVLRKRFRAPQGLILVTGPTGSGKTTTVHAGLNFISNEEINIATLEDPVEATFFGINHIPVNKQCGVTFASGLRSILRQDPDVIFIGEMRDPEVAAIAMQAAQTGHLVLSTLHTNSALESVERLTDLGVPAYLTASSLLLVVAQRLVRKICDHCARPYELSSGEISMLGLTPEQLEDATPRLGHGCERCMGSGYRGRVAVFELLEVDREVRERIRNQASPQSILASARKAGMTTLLEAGRDKVLVGETTPAELRRVLTLDY